MGKASLTGMYGVFTINFHVWQRESHCDARTARRGCQPSTAIPERAPSRGTIDAISPSASANDHVMGSLQENLRRADKVQALFRAFVSGRHVNVLGRRGIDAAAATAASRGAVSFSAALFAAVLPH